MQSASSPNMIRKILKLFVYLDSFELRILGDSFLVVEKFNLFGLLELIPLEEIINLNVILWPLAVKRFFFTTRLSSIQEHISKEGGEIAFV